MSFSARRAIDQVCVERATFVLGKLAMQISGQPVVDFLVNRCHGSNPLKRVPGEVVYAEKPEPGLEFRAVRHC